jgi:orotidine-5'-phosphate decarboxylase
MSESPSSRIIAALDTSDVGAAEALVRRLAPFVGAFKAGHGLVLAEGLGALDRLRRAGADRIFLDLKFHDIPNSVALAVRAAAQAGVWMTTLHLSGGRAMVEAAAEASAGRTLVMGVSALTSLSEDAFRDEAGAARPLAEHLAWQADWGLAAGVDGLICSPHECAGLRATHPEAVLAVPGIRSSSGSDHDQARTASAAAALAAGASYLVIGRALTEAEDPAQALAELGL